MIPFLKKFYSPANNGKMELFGIDGMEHTVISAAIHVFVMTIVFLMLFKGYNPTSYEYAIFWMKNAGIITFIIMRFVWFFIEKSQEKNMILTDPDRPKELWKFWTWSSARKVDMYYPLIGDGLLVLSVSQYF